MSFEKAQIRLVLLVLGGTVAALLAIYFFVFRESYVPAYENIRPSDASAIVAALNEAGLPYRLANDGHDILVPDNRVSEVRVLVAGSDIPMGGTVGFELFNDTDMGLTEFAQKINLQRALQGELARTIMAMDGVAFARVHLALPERSIFSAERESPTAAVTIQMQPGQALSPQRVDGVRQLVAHSVPDLAAGAVAVLDERGDLVSGVPAPSTALAGPLSERAALDQYYQARARGAIEAAAPRREFEVSVNTRRTIADPAVPDGAARAEPSREQIALNVLVRTEDELSPEERERIETAVADALELDRSAGDSLTFTTGFVAAGEAVALPRSVGPSASPATAGDPTSEPDWGWLFNRWVLTALALLAIIALVLRPRRRLDDTQTEQFADLLKTGLAERDTADVR